MKRTINIISDTTYSSKAHGVHTSFLNHKQFCEQNLALKVTVNNVFSKSKVDHHHTIGFLFWFFLIIHPGRKHILHGHVIYDSLVGSIKLPGFTSKIAKWYLGVCYKLADEVVAVSEYVKSSLVKDHNLPEEKIVVIRNLVVKNDLHLAKAGARKKLELESDERIILSVGQIQPRKRFDMFIEQARNLPDVRFVWVGDTVFRASGEGTDEMDKLKENIPDNLILAGLVNYEDIPVYYIASDVFTLLSDQESGHPPMAVLEAFLYELPVLARKECFGDNSFESSALLVEDIEITNQLIELLENRELSSKLTSNATKYLNQKVIKRAEELYSELYK